MSWPTRRWPLGVLLPVLAFGVAAGVLMTWHHEAQAYGGTQVELIGCAESASINCDVVNTSEWSELVGVPLATIAAATYLALLAVTLLVLRGKREAHLLLIIAGVVATATSAWLFYVSKVQLGFLCSWCLRMYGVNVAILVLSLLAGRPTRPTARSLGLVGAIGLGLFLVSVGAQRAYRSTLLGPGGSALAKGGAFRSSDDGLKLAQRTFDVTTEDNHVTQLKLNSGDAWKGNPRARVTVVEFADLECGFCKRASGELKRLVESYGDRVLFVFKHYPMNTTCNPSVKNTRHAHACDASVAATCAQEQKKFWPFHDLAFKNQHQLDLTSLRQYAQQVGLDVEQFNRCLADHHTQAAILADAELGGRLDIHGTPRLFIGGKVYRGGTSAEAIAKPLEEALGAKPGQAQPLASAAHAERPIVPIPADVSPTRALSFEPLKFSIDTFEASLENGAAVSGKHRVPATRMSWFAARDACAAAGKRLCTEQEWVSACQGALAVDDNHNGQYADDMIEGTAYPYGDYHDANRCWDDKLQDTFRPVYTGELPGCVTAAGVYDLTGNVEEWVGDSPEHAVLLGGAWDTKEDHARCYRRNDSFGAGYSSPRSGFRCCAAIGP